MKVYVIGAGPAGIAASIAAARNGNSVTLLEKNEKIGKKLFITGKGRCNVTNACSFEEFISNVVSNPKFLYSSLRAFGWKDTAELIESAGVRLKTERGNRVFPLSDKSSDIIKAFSELLKRSSVDVRLNEKVLSLKHSNNRITEILTEKSLYTDCDAVVVATGGLSYPSTGSDGDGYKFAADAGHSVVPPVAALTGLYLKEMLFADGKAVPFSEFRKLQGVSLKNVRAAVVRKGKILFDEFGEMIFTDKGVSGPIILTLSSEINRLDFSELQLVLDLKPALSEGELANRILRDFSASLNKDFKNSLDLLLPSGVISAIIASSKIKPDKKVNSVTKEERITLAKTLKNWTFNIGGTEELKNAVVTAGGVSVKEINPVNMKSKFSENLYFVGEVLDVDALTGGFNIQIALSTGYCAGSHINNKGGEIL